MIPKYLKIKGLYSYQTEQEIHFDALTDASLFGIFGSVGSGKSTILEAITFALYGDTERLNKSGDERTYNMMNLRSDDLLIDFECLAGKSTERYRFTVRGKRNAKNFKEVKTFERRAYIWKENGWLPLSEQETTESIIGLSYDNFRRTIIIPQGRFQEFIELKDAERTRMMKELFQLEKYDLSRNVSSLAKENDLLLSEYAGKLDGLLEVNSEIIDQQEKEKSEIQAAISITQDKLTSLVAQLTLMEQLKVSFEKMQLLQNQVLQYESQKDIMSGRERTLKTYEICTLHFKAPLETQRNLKENIERNQQNVRNNEVRQKELEKLITQYQEILAKLKLPYENRQELLEEAEELEKVIQVKDLQKKISLTKASIVDLEKKLVEQENLIALTKQQKTTLEEQNELRKGQLIDTNILSEVHTWFATLDEIQGNRKTILKAANDLVQESDKIQAIIKEGLESAIPVYQLEIADTANLQDVSQSIQTFIKRSQSEKETLLQQTVGLQTQLALSQYASNLSDGQPCPLCGSEHHPSILHADAGLQTEISGIEATRTQIQQKEESIRKFFESIQKSFGTIEILEKQKSTIKEQYADVQNRIKSHQENFVWSQFNKENREEFQKQFLAIQDLQKEIKVTDDLLKNKSIAIETLTSDKTEKIEKPLQAIQNEVLKIESSVETILAQIIRIEIDNFRYTESSEIKSKVEQLKLNHTKLIQEFEKTDSQINVFEKENNTINGSQVALKENIEISLKELQNIENAIQKNLNNFNFESIDAIKNILARPLDIDQERTEIEDYKNKLNTTKRDLDILQQENQNKVYQPELHLQITQENAEITISLNTLRKEEGRLDGSIKKLQEDLRKKETFLQEKSKLELRKNHLDDLAKLFRSSGFVDYVSSIYLQNLIQAANPRFHQMTGQRLHLELGEGNSFWVRDLLNGGHMRLLKTLSGGQKFQAALSLALALADHIHIRHESKHNFFFLDEGFGSLDKDALQTVFDTLKSLRKENRIVGIISHVEDLQQEIQTYLKIEQSEDGSCIIPSWEQ